MYLMNLFLIQTKHETAPQFVSGYYSISKYFKSYYRPPLFVTLIKITTYCPLDDMWAASKPATELFFFRVPPGN